MDRPANCDIVYPRLNGVKSVRANAVSASTSNIGERYPRFISAVSDINVNLGKRGAGNRARSKKKKAAHPQTKLAHLQDNSRMYSNPSRAWPFHYYACSHALPVYNPP